MLVGLDKNVLYLVSSWYMLQGLVNQTLALCSTTNYREVQEAGG